MRSRTGGPSFVITAATFTGNHGAEAMLLATMDGVRARIPSASFDVFSYYPTQDRAVVTDSSVRVFSLTPLAVAVRLVPLAVVYALLRWVGLTPLLRAFPDDIRALAEAEVQLDLAGVSFVEGREVFLPFNVLTLVPAMVVGTPVVKLSQAMGPFRRPLNRVAARATLRHCAAIFARGARTLDHLRSLALKGPVIQEAPDLAFLLESGRPGDAPATGRPGDAPAAGQPNDASATGPPNDASAGEPRREATESLLTRLGGRSDPCRCVVGMAPSSLLAARLGPAYVDLMATVVTRLAEAGDLVVVFPHASRGSAEAGPRNNDLHVVRQLSERIPEGDRKRIVMVEHDLPARNIQRLLAAFDMAVVSRFHAMVGCLAAGRPVVVVGWSHKYAEVMEAFALGAHAFDAEGVTPEDVLGSLASFRTDLERHRTGLATKLRETRLRAATQLDYVAEMVSAAAPANAAGASSDARPSGDPPA